MTSPNRKKDADHALQVGDLRTLHFYANYLNDIHPKLPFNSIARAESVPSMRALLENYFDKHFESPESRKVINNLLCEAASQELLPSESFTWLKEDEDACIFSWAYLAREYGGMNTIAPPGAYERSLTPTGGYDPTSNEERYRAILQFFDRPTGKPRTEKEQHLRSLQKHWFLSEKEVKSFTWLSDEDDDGCRWAWNYLDEYDRRERSQPYDSTMLRPPAPVNSGINSLSLFRPVSTKKRLLSVYAVLRLWQCHHSEKTLLIKNMSKAWRQRQLRRERENKKAINSYVDIEVKEKLEMLARHFRCQINEVLSDLIEKEFSVHEDAIRKLRRL